MFKLGKSFFKMFIRNRQAMIWSFAFPVIMMIIFGNMFRGSMKVDVGVVDKANNKASQQLVENMEKVDVLVLHKGSEEDEKDQLSKGKLSYLIVIPENFKLEPKITPKGPVFESITILGFSNIGKAQQAQVAENIIKEIIGSINRGITKSPEILIVKNEVYNSQNLGYIDFLLPGLLAMSIMQAGIIGIANVVTTQRERGVLKRLLATPMKPVNYFGGQLIGRIGTSLVQMIMMLAMGVFAFGAHVIGNIWLALLILLFGAIIFLTIGLAVASVAPNSESVGPVASLFTLPMLLLGGVFFPLEQMPNYLQAIAKFLPLTYLTDATRGVMNQGYTLGMVGNDLLVLSIWAIAAFLVVVKFFKWESA